MSYAPVTGSDELARIVVDASKVELAELSRDVDTSCEFCPRNASHRLTCTAKNPSSWTMGLSVALVCKSHARHAAICMVGTL